MLLSLWYTFGILWSTAGTNSRDSDGGTNTQCLPANPEYLTTINGHSQCVALLLEESMN